MIKRFFTYHPFMKMFSLLLASLLWFAIRTEKHREMNVNIPIRYVNLPSGTTMAGPIPDMIRLKLRGSNLRMAKMDDEFFSPYQINLEDANMGLNTFRIFSEDFKVPFGVTIDRIQPATIHVDLAKSIIKAVPIDAKIVGHPAPGFAFKSKKVSPMEVQIRSYPAQLDMIQSLRTEEIPLDGKNRSFEGDFKVDTRGLNVAVLNSSVHVVVEIEEKKGTETILSIPIRWSDQDGILLKKSNAHFVPDTVSIKITGPSSKVFDLVKTPPSPMVSHKQVVSALKQRKEALIRVDLPKINSIQFEVEPRTVKLVYGQR